MPPPPPPPPGLRGPHRTNHLKETRHGNRRPHRRQGRQARRQGQGSRWQATDDESLEREGHLDQAKGAAKDAAEDVKDAARKAADHVKDAMGR
ncbi:CsbD family protein [Salana multivorans]